jgi:hypothetical protein
MTRRSLARALVLAGLLAGLLPGPAARARDIEITAAAGDTSRGLALRYYGSAGARAALLHWNGLPEDTARLTAGQRLRLPTAWSYPVRPGDTWDQLAADYLADARHARLLAELNGKPPAQPPTPGHLLVIPALLKLTVDRRTPLRALVARVSGWPAGRPLTQELAGQIARINGLAGDDVAAGARILVPLMHHRLVGWFLPSDLPLNDPGTERRVVAVLASARADLQAGRYVDAALRLAPVPDLPGARRARRVEALVLLATAQVALGRLALAREAAAAALKLDPRLRLDPDQVSPKVRALFGPEPAAR